MELNRWRFAWAWTIGAVLLLPACKIPAPQPPTPPTTPPPPIESHEPVCTPPGLVTGCWHMPPGEGWQFIPSPAPAPPNPPPIPPMTGCILVGEPGPILDAPDTTSAATVNAVMSRLTGCSVGSRCILNVTLQEWQAHVEAALRAEGLCAGQHEPGTDEIAVATHPGAVWQAYHIGAGDDSSGPLPPGGAPRTVVWNPGAARRAYLPPGGLTPGPAPIPTPVPPTPPVVGSCTDPVPPKVDRWNPLVLINRWWDATPLAYGRETRRWDGTPVDSYCASIGMPDRLHCPARKECGEVPDPTAVKCKERAACERILVSGRPDGAPKWECDGELELDPTNIMKARCFNGTRLRVCSADGLVCSAEVVP